MTIPRHWLDSYPAGVPADIDPLQIRSVAHLAEESFTRFADRVAFVQMGRNITYRDLDTQTRAFGAWLQQHTGLKRGGRVAIMMPNLLQYPIALFGVLRAGGTVVNTNPLYTARELEHQLKDSGAETVVILENFAHVLQEVIGRTQVKHVVVTSVGELLGFPKGAIVDFVVRTVRKQVPAWSLPGHHRFLDVLAVGARHALQQIDLGHDDLAFLQYTGGTTGVSKGAMLSHGNIAANVLQSTAWTEPAWPKDQTGIAITALPLYHIFALTGNCILFLRIGWTNVLITNPRDFPGFVKEIAKYRFTFISGVNTLFNALLHTPGFEKVDFSALRCTPAVSRSSTTNDSSAGRPTGAAVARPSSGNTTITTSNGSGPYPRMSGSRQRVTGRSVIRPSPAQWAGPRTPRRFGSPRSACWLPKASRPLRSSGLRSGGRPSICPDVWNTTSAATTCSRTASRSHSQAPASPAPTPTGG
jgi:long-chain acyl-CoA synthetase